MTYLCSSLGLGSPKQFLVRPILFSSVGFGLIVKLSFESFWAGLRRDPSKGRSFSNRRLIPNGLKFFIFGCRLPHKIQQFFGSGFEGGVKVASLEPRLVVVEGLGSGGEGESGAAILERKKGRREIKEIRI
ncbi:hypothetical protein COLO4_07942 [Corchorus olitorius]|uniref:Uncharacterized protein n=1 Tax=Corchorus olitorius TaxID=93759 RepID=A0A1R3KI23_9ROSI|nr:hypothetical protein COLO4_07942 [Corchorus olitorius]